MLSRNQMMSAQTANAIMMQQQQQQRRLQAGRDLYIAIKITPRHWLAKFLIFTESWQSFGQAAQNLFQWEENFPKAENVFF